MRFQPSFLDEIRDRVPISQIVGGRVTWDRRKSNAGRGDWWACCPFHGEKSPSFHCEDKKGRYHCFGCGASGDHFRFLTEAQGLSFPEAVEQVAGLAGVPMPARDEKAEEREKQRASLHEVMDMAAKFFQAQLQSAAGARARAYLRERWLTPATQNKFGLGFAPDSRNALKEHLAAKGVSKEQIEACGLVVHGADVPVSYDRFRDRIMFPILDAKERVIAFGGRAMSADVMAKYLNSPDTELFHKGDVLFNFARARKVLGKEKETPILAVEGYMDVIALAQAGFGQAVAPLGTALTERQLELLWRVSPEPVLCFDGDGAGLRAAWRAADLALPLIEPGRTVRFALLPEGQDPDDLVKSAGPEAFGAVLADTRSLADMIWMRETRGRDFSAPERRAELDKTLRDLTARIKDESVRFHYAQEMRDRAQAFFGLSPRPKRKSEGDKKAPSAWSGRPGAASASSARTEQLLRSALVKRAVGQALERAGGLMPLREAVIVVALANHPTLIEENFDVVESLEPQHPDLRQLLLVLIDALAESSETGLGNGEVPEGREHSLSVIARHGLTEVWERAVTLVKRSRDWAALEDAAVEDTREVLAQMLHLHRNAGILHKELKAAEAALASEPTDEHFRQLLDIQAQFRDAQATEALIEGFGVPSGRVLRN
jgi:DNA primase